MVSAPCVPLPDNAHYINECAGYACDVGYFSVTLVGARLSAICMKELTCSPSSTIGERYTTSQYCSCNSGYYLSPTTITRINATDSNGFVIGYDQQENSCLPCTECGTDAMRIGTCSSDAYTDFRCACKPGYQGPSDPITYQQINCTQCSPGTYSNFASSECFTCGPGKYSTLTSCETCAQGTYTNTQEKTCDICTSGFFASSLDLTVCEMCVAGTYSVGIACISCGQGEYSVNASTACYECLPGSYNDIPEAPQCQTCRAGYFSNQSAMTECLECQDGTFSQYNASTCVTCMPGYVASAGSSTCMICEPGTYQPSVFSSSCVTCLEKYTFSQLGGATTCTACTQCLPEYGEYYAFTCNITSDATCQTCTTCQKGEYMESECMEMRNRVCLPCEPCPNGTFFEGGCINGEKQVCQPCTACVGAVLAKCTPIDDTVCSFNADCHAKTSSFHVYSWMTDGSIPASKFNGCTKGQYIADLNPLVCRDCPEWLHGPNGLWCEPCKGYMEPYPDQSSCVCISPSVIKSGDVCECDAGFFVDYQGCQPCEAGTFKNFSVVLEDNWWDQNVPCLACPHGSWSFPQASACFSCLPGQYRANESLQGCESCASGFYALDATRSDSCVACSTSCHPGFYQLPCPLYDLSDKFICMECAPIPVNASWTVDCYYNCSTGFYKFNDTCVPCSSQDCPIGFMKQACTLYADINCDVPCTNESKPVFHSVWDRECSWACETGYLATALDYGMWTQYECIEESTKPFWLW